MGVNTLLYRTSRLSSPPVSSFAPRILPLCFARQGALPLGNPHQGPEGLGSNDSGAGAIMAPAGGERGRSPLADHSVIEDTGGAANLERRISALG